jgi:hypothetical protein
MLVFVRWIEGPSGAFSFSICFNNLTGVFGVIVNEMTQHHLELS